MRAYLLYFPENPTFLFSYLDSEKERLFESELILFVDNNDHKVSSEFYTLRKYIRKGFPLKVVIAPPPGGPDEVFAYLVQEFSLESRTDLKKVVNGDDWD